MKLTTTKKAFKAWLESKSPRSQVGINSLKEHCPLAKYFQELNKTNSLVITIEDEVCLNGEDGYKIKGVPHKPWMENFITKIDDLTLDGNPHKKVPISAKKALDILSTC